MEDTLFMGDFPLKTPMKLVDLELPPLMRVSQQAEETV